MARMPSVNPNFIGNESVMKSFLFLAAVVFITTTGFNTIRNSGKGIEGSWQLKTGTGEEVLLFVDGYFTHTSFNKNSKKFIQTRGGQYTLNNDQLVIQFEFDTKNSTVVGEEKTYSVKFNGDDLLSNLDGSQQTFTRIDDGKAPLAGVWNITSRMQDEKLVPIHRTGTRKTLKILSGKRFQWAAIDPGAKQFMGTGGGTYTFENGKYTEHIEFFSRDSSRVGASLSFDGKLENGDWHHSGLSSKGDKIYEVWSKINSVKQ